MDFKICFKNQLKMHPSMQYRDAVKLCYQASFGAEHLLSDVERARAYLYAEFESVLPSDEPLFEEISPEIARVNLGAWKREERNIEALFEAFKKSAFIREDAKECFASCLLIAESIMLERMPDFDFENWQVFLEKYRAEGMPPIHHSEIYREREKPSYRIVKISALEEIL